MGSAECGARSLRPSPTSIRICIFSNISARGSRQRGAVDGHLPLRTPPAGLRPPGEQEPEHVGSRKLRGNHQGRQARSAGHVEVSTQGDELPYKFRIAPHSVREQEETEHVFRDTSPNAIVAEQFEHDRVLPRLHGRLEGLFRRETSRDERTDDVDSTLLDGKVQRRPAAVAGRQLSAAVEPAF